MNALSGSASNNDGHTAVAWGFEFGMAKPKDFACLCRILRGQARDSPHPASISPVWEYFTLLQEPASLHALG